MQGAFVDIGRDVVAVPFLIVGCEMLCTGHNSLALYAFYHTCRSLSGKEGVFSVVFEVAPAKRGAVYVHSGTEQDVDASGACILADACSHFHDHIPVPCRCCRHSAGIQGAFLVAADELCAEVVAYALRTVRHTDFRNSEAVYGADEEGIVASDIVDFFLEGHLLYQSAGPCFVFRSDRLGQGMSRGEHGRTQNEYGSF